MNTTIMQGTTPVFSFTLPFESAQVESFFLTFRQGKETVIEKKLTDCETKEYELSVTLSQEDTFLLQSQTPVLMQVRMSSLVFGAAMIAFSLLYCAVAGVLVYKYAGRTFRLRN